MGVFLAFGAPVKSGLLGAVALVIISVLLGVALAGFGLMVALRTGSPEATQAMFPLIFVAIFVSSAFFPTELMKGWYQQVAEVNPITLIINPTRELVITGWSWADFGQAVSLTILVAVVSLSLSYRAYLARLASS
jgi:ABC-2 type transport system permease protein